jgi:hypothetical protein
MNRMIEEGNKLKGGRVKRVGTFTFYLHLYLNLYLTSFTN